MTAPPSDAASIFMSWVYACRPEYLTEQGRDLIKQRLPTYNVQTIRQMTRPDFFKVATEALHQTRRKTGA